MFSKKNVEYCTLEEMNKHLKYCLEYRQIHFREKTDLESFRWNAYLVDRTRYIEITYRKASKRCTYKFDKLGNGEDHQMIDGIDAYRILSKYVKVPKLITNKDDAKFSAVPLLWYNEKYNKTRVNAICYDMNSAYANAMLHDIPDTSQPYEAKHVGPGEVGFSFDLDGRVCLKYKGFAPYVFKTMPSPFKRFVEVYYERKRKAKTKQEKRKYKEVLNFCVGYLQGRNEFVRAFIVLTANNIIKSLMDENTIYCNTDSIVSLVERPDLKLGDGIGEWKVEHTGEFAYNGFNYQWNKDQPSVRGKSKEYFKDGWDILKDPLPDVSNKYELNYRTFQLEETDYAKTK